MQFTAITLQPNVCVRNDSDVFVMEKERLKVSGALKVQISLEARIVEEDKFTVSELSGRFYTRCTIAETRIRFVSCVAKLNS